MYLPSKVFACSPTPEALSATPFDNLQKADVVFVGKAIKVVGATTPSLNPSSMHATTTFEVSRYWKGNVTKYIFASSVQDHMCGWGIPIVGQEYLIYGRYTQGQNSDLRINSFTGSKSLSSASVDLMFLGQGNAPQEENNYVFQRNLRVGMTGEDVRELQKYLNRNNFIIAVTGPGSLRNETTYFGYATKAALVKFQTAYAGELGITKGTGYFGQLTRNFINQ